MKLYYFMIIVIGLMYTFSLAGIETGSNRAINMLIPGGNVTEVDINPNVADYENYNVRDMINKSNWWLAIVIGLAVFIFVALLGGIKVLGSSTADINSLVVAGSAAIASLLLAMFAVDFWSVLLYMRELTGGTGWEYHLTWILIVPILFGFTISLIQFVKGSAD